jgi:hypothetical protein
MVRPSDRRPAAREARRRQGTHDPAHDRDDVLERGRSPDVGGAVPRKPVRFAAGVLQGRGRTAQALERPATRKALLAGLAEKGFGREPLAEMQKAIEAGDSDLFDVLAYVAFASAPQTREARATAARVATAQQFTDRQRAFVDFVLAQYVAQGVDELDAEKLSPLLKLKYRNALQDAIAELGQPDQIRGVFTGFQRHLYEAGGKGR